MIKNVRHRKRLLTFYAAILSCMIFPGINMSYAAIHQGATQSLNEFTAHLNEKIPRLMHDYDIPGVSLAIVREGKTVWSHAWGYADRDQKRKMTLGTWCRVESISKSVTAWGVMKLVEKGKIDLGAPVGKYLGKWKFPPSEFSLEKVTIRRLLSNSAGMPLGTIGVRYAPGVEKPSLKESLTRDAHLMQKPGKSFSYSNTGFNLLELLIEEVTGRDFAVFMEKEVLLPLEMKHSSFRWRNNFSPPVAFGYDLDGNAIAPYVYPEKASGGLFSTVNDIARFIAAGMPDYSTAGSKVLSRKSIQEIYTPAVDIPGYYGLVFKAYGFGHFIETLPGNTRAVAHGGQGSGWMTHFHSVPGTGDGIVILTNSQRSWPFIASILTDWAKWRGYSSVGMGKILAARRGIQGLLALIVILLFWQIWRITKGIRTGQRHFAFSGKKNQNLSFRTVQSVFAIIIMVGLAWVQSLDYFFMSSVFPLMFVWLQAALFFSALLLALSAVFPESGEKQK